MTNPIDTEHARQGAKLLVRTLKEPLDDVEAYKQLIASMAIYVCSLADAVDGTPERESHLELLK